jgi:uncharacterized protein YxjI
LKLIFRDNFFSAGQTEIVDEHSQPMGELDLKSSFGSSVDVYGSDGRLACAGKFRRFSNKWEVAAGDGRLLGTVRYRMSFFDKKFEYDAGARGIFRITSPAFSREYTIQNHMGREVARFGRISGWFSSGAYALENLSDELESYELIAVVMGVHSIQKRHQSAASS